MHLHPDLLPQKAMSLGNQVSCMIAEYHLTTSTRQSSLMDHAMALQVAVWLHQLDMAVGGKVQASESLEASQHHLGPLLESFLTPRTSKLTYQEVVERVLTENRRASEESLHHLLGCRTHDSQVLDGLIKAHRKLDKADKATQKSLKKEIDQRCKSLETLKEQISYCETQLGRVPSEGNTPGGDGPVSHGAQAEMAPTLAPADDAPSESAMTLATPASDPPPAEDQDMEVDDYATRPSLPSPVSHEDDNLLLGPPQSEVTEVQSGLAHLPVSSPRARMGRVMKPPTRRHSPSHTILIGRHLLWVPPELPCGRREATRPDEEGPVKPTTREDSRATLL